MTVRATIVDGPLPEAPAGSAPSGAGATVCFEGRVRPSEDSRPIRALEYTCYRPMADRELLSLATNVATAHGLAEIRVWHSQGRVGVGECSFRLEVFATHRKAALAATDEFIDRMKRDVPIWKKVEWLGEEDA